MAKSIKVIECPKCGSTKKTELKTDYFRCDNCNTEYFLDNDDVNINHNVNYRDTDNAVPFKLPNIPKKIVFGALGFILLSFLLLNLPFFKGGSANVASKRSEVRWNRNTKLAFLNSEGNPMILVVGEKYFYNADEADNKNKFFAEVHDGTTGKVVKSMQIEGVLVATSRNFETKSFSNGDLYFIINKNQVFKFDQNNYSISEVTKSLFKNSPQFSAGLASIEFVYSNYGDGFNTLTNDGNNLYYYPIVDKVYKKDEFYPASHGMESVLPIAKEKLAFTFSRINSDFGNEKVHLVKYIYKDNGGGPKDDVTFEWRKDFGTSSGANSERNKVFLTKFMEDNARIISFEILSPDRLFFKPQVLYSDKDFVLISFNTTAAEEAPTAIQCLNAQTGAIVFTTTLSENKNLNDAIRYKNGFIVPSYKDFFNIGSDGKMIREIEIL